MLSLDPAFVVRLRPSSRWLTSMATVAAPLAVADAATVPAVEERSRVSGGRSSRRRRWSLRRRDNLTVEKSACAAVRLK